MLPFILRPKGEAIKAWQSSSTLVHIGGLEQTRWADTTYISGGTTGYRTFIMNSHAIRQHCNISQVIFGIRSIKAGTEDWAFRVYRWDQGTSKYVYYASQSFTPVAGVNTITISPAIAVIPGDVPGFMIPGDAGQENTLYYTAITAKNPAARWVALDVTTSDAFGSVFANTVGLHMDVLATRPYLAASGDSIMVGHGGADPWYGALESAAVTRTPGGSPGAITHEPTNQIRGLTGSGSLLKYQNLAHGGQTFQWVAAVGMLQCILVNPKVILIHAGVNDVSTARSWAQILADLNTIKAAQPTGTRLLIDEILPWTAGSDAQAATIRSFNPKLATWCIANNAVLVPCHDAMGQTRPSTGELDDLLAAFDADGVHLTDAGVNALSALIRMYLI